ncbi:hypothetical protein ACFLSQ_00975 [Bacteroidota bacterium]
MNIMTKDDLKFHFDYFGFLWCQTLFSIGDLYGIEKDLEKLATELKLNYHKLEFHHELYMIHFFLLLVNPDNLSSEIHYNMFGEQTVKYANDSDWKNEIDGLHNLDLANDSEWEGKIHTLFIKKPDFPIPDSKYVYVPDEKITYTYLKKLILKNLLNQHGAEWYLTGPVDEVIL